MLGVLDDGKFHIADKAGGPVTERLTVDTIGNVGIGTITPSEKFEVDGNIKLSGNLVSDNDICIGSCGQLP